MYVRLPLIISASKDSNIANLCDHLKESNGVDIEEICDRIPGDYSSSLIYLALCGWTADLRSSSKSSRALPLNSSAQTPPLPIRCLYCRRNMKVGPSPPAPSDGEDSTDAPPAKKSKLSETISFEPVQDHKLYCPWTTIVPGEKHLGWQLCLRAVILSLGSSRPPVSSEATGPQSDTTEAAPVSSGGETLQERLSRTLQRVQSFAEL